MKKITVLFAMIGLFTFSSSLIAQDWNKEQLELWKSVESSWNKWKANDIDGTLADFHSKYKGWNVDQPVPVSKERLTKWWSMMKDVKIDYVDLVPVSITIVGNAAVVHYYFEFSMKWGEAKEGKKREGKNTEFYIREGGKWMLLGDFTYEDKDD